MTGIQIVLMVFLTAIIAVLVATFFLPTWGAALLVGSGMVGIVLGGAAMVKGIMELLTRRV